MVMKEIRITFDDENGFDVHFDGKCTGGKLTFGEVIEQVAALLRPELHPHVYHMKSQEEWDAYEDRK
jgi:hypothetical protein